MSDVAQSACLDAFGRTVGNGWDQSYRWHWDIGSDCCDCYTLAVSWYSTWWVMPVGDEVTTCCLRREEREDGCFLHLLCTMWVITRNSCWLATIFFSWGCWKNSSWKTFPYERCLESFVCEHSKLTDCLKLVQ